jgi:hypothetical protein
MALYAQMSVEVRKRPEEISRTLTEGHWPRDTKQQKEFGTMGATGRAEQSAFEAKFHSASSLYTMVIMLPV